MDPKHDVHLGSVARQLQTMGSSGEGAPISNSTQCYECAFNGTCSHAYQGAAGHACNIEDADNVFCCPVDQTCDISHLMCIPNSSNNAASNGQNSDQGNGGKGPLLEAVLPSVIGGFCILLAMGVIVYYMKKKKRSRRGKSSSGLDSESDDSDYDSDLDDSDLAQLNAQQANQLRQQQLLLEQAQREAEAATERLRQLEYQNNSTGVAAYPLNGDYENSSSSSSSGRGEKGCGDDTPPFATLVPVDAVDDDLITDLKYDHGTMPYAVYLPQSSAPPAPMSPPPPPSPSAPPVLDLQDGEDYYEMRSPHRDHHK